MRLRLPLVALLLLASPAAAETFAGGVVAGASTTAQNPCRGYSPKIIADPPNTVGLEAAWAECESEGGCHLYIPKGVYEDVALTYDTNFSGPVCVEGEGDDTILRAIVADAETPNAPVFQVGIGPD